MKIGEIVNSIISFLNRLNEHKFLLFVVIPFFLSYFISHFTLLILVFLKMLVSDFQFKDNYSLYVSSGSMLTTSISILVTACIGYYFSPLKPTASKLTVVKIAVLIITSIIAISGIFTYILSSGIIDTNVNVPLSKVTYTNFIYSMVALVLFNIWNFKADAAKSHTDKELRDRGNLHK